MFHTKLGQIITGANSKRQPELATFSEKVMGQVFHMPLSSRLQMSDIKDRLSLSFNTFWADVEVPAPPADRMALQFTINGKGSPPEAAQLTLQLVLKEGELLETGAGRRFTVGLDRIDLAPADIGGWIRHRGWTMKPGPAASLKWPVYPHNPYADAPEKSLAYAVAALSVPLELKQVPGKYVRPKEQQITVSLEAQ